MGRKWVSARERAICEVLEGRRLLTRIAVVGDFSSDDGSDPVHDVSDLVKSWNPSAVVTVGDNNYPSGQASTIDSNIGQWYHQFISPYSGSFGAGASDGQNHFWPTPGNHDWDSPDATLAPYRNYFTLPNNERYYKVSLSSDIDLFAIDSDNREPDGVASNSVQANYIHQQMMASTAKWKLVAFHESPFTSGGHGDNVTMQWPFKDWGATAVLTGHDHDYERLAINGLTYIVDGLGGETLSDFITVHSGSQVRYNDDYGALRIDTTDTTLTFTFVNRDGQTIDTYSLTSSGSTPTANFIPMGATWKYLDTGVSQGTAWKNLTGFDDSTWKSGAAELGYGDGDEATVVSFGPNANSKYVTTYFRKTFAASDISNIATLALNLVRDDGAVVYLNGTEVFRDNMPSGTISFSTLASTTQGGDEEEATHPANIDPALLVNGNNVIAVEIHQSDVTSSDISFNFELNATLIADTPPAAPTGLAATATSTTSIHLNWTDKSNNETGFAIERGTDGVSFSPITTVAANAIAYDDPGLTAGATYYYRVRAITTTTQSSYSNTAHAITTGVPTAQTLIPIGSIWKYLDDGSNQNTAWRAIAYNDSNWKSGAAQLGYGDGDEATVLGFGTEPDEKFITTYFRKAFTIADPSAVTALTMRLLRDDGAVVYLNGTEVYRSNMPTGTIGYTTLASSQVEDNTFYTASIAPSLLVAGNNVIAVEIHQGSIASSDISFDLELKATVTNATPPSVPQAPSGLGATAVSSSQINLAWTDASGNETGFIIERSTDNFVANVTQVATTPANMQTYSDFLGLNPSTQYYYRVRATNAQGPSSNSNVANATTLALPSVPSPWTDADIGSPGVTGSASYVNGTFTLRGGGDVWSTADSAHFVYQPFTGDGQIIARVNAWVSGHNSAYAGVMFRESLAANARETSLVIDKNNLIGFIRRTTTGGTSTAPSNITGSKPIWLKLVKVGTSFSAWRSSNGTTWTQISTTQTIGMTASTIYVGLAVASSVNGTLSTYSVDGVTVSSSTDPQLPANVRTNPPPTTPAMSINSLSGIAIIANTPPQKKPLLDQLQ